MARSTRIVVGRAGTWILCCYPVHLLSKPQSPKLYLVHFSIFPLNFRWWAAAASKALYTFQEILKQGLLDFLAFTWLWRHLVNHFHVNVSNQSNIFKDEKTTAIEINKTRPSWGPCIDRFIFYCFIIIILIIWATLNAFVFLTMFIVCWLAPFEGKDDKTTPAGIGTFIKNFLNVVDNKYWKKEKWPLSYFIQGVFNQKLLPDQIRGF